MYAGRENAKMARKGRAMAVKRQKETDPEI